MALSPDLISCSSTLLCAEDAGDVTSWDEESAADEEERCTVCPAAVAAVLQADSHSLAFLLAAETHHMPRPDYLSGRSLADAARCDAVKWILKVSEFYRFRAATPYLAVNYLDRFLSSHSLPSKETEEGVNGGGGVWPMQLLSVACVSVAAKMEETRVPELQGLQILGPAFVFDPRTVRRMELFLMAALGWRMRAITPLDFLPHLAASPTSTLLARAADLVLSTLHVKDFLRYRPSTVAAAAASLCAADDVAAEFGCDLQHRPDEWVNKEAVSRCRQLMVYYFLDTCHSAPPVPPPPPSLHPPSPDAVLDAAAACGSCDSAAQTLPPSLAAEPPPPPRRKRRRS